MCVYMHTMHDAGTSRPLQPTSCCATPATLVHCWKAGRDGFTVAAAEKPEIG